MITKIETALMFCVCIGMTVLFYCLKQLLRMKYYFFGYKKPIYETVSGDPAAVRKEPFR